MTDNTFSSRTPKRVAKDLTLVSSQKIWDLVPVLPLIPSDLG